MHSLTPSSRTRRLTLWSGLLTVGALLAGGAAHAAPTADTPTVEAPAAADEGDTFTVAVALPASADVFAYTLTLGFDPALVEYVVDSASGPDGGFESVSTTADAVTLTHTRLGGSPALDGDLVLFSADFVALAGGSASFDLDALTLVGSDSEELVVDAVVSVDTDIAAEDDGTGGGGDDGGDDGGTGGGDTGGDDGGTDGGDTGTGDGTGSGDEGSVGGSDADGLSDTGASPMGLIAIAAVALVFGIALVARKSVMSR